MDAQLRPNFFPIVPQSLSYLLEFPVSGQGDPMTQGPEGSAGGMRPSFLFRVPAGPSSVYIYIEGATASTDHNLLSAAMDCNTACIQDGPL